MKKIIFPLWIASAIALFLYSFTQVDLSLTFSQASILQTFQKAFQQVGWFNRPLSAVLFLAIFGAMFALYITTLNLIRKKVIEWKLVWKTTIVVSIILFLSYNAFSYDLFNYIFDAKIFAFYNQNPYLHKALDFPTDPMLSFMRWTHRTYPYGPLWIGMTIPVYYLGLGIFSVTFYLFKLLMVASFVGSVYLVKKIADKLNINSTFAAAAFALNPLVLTESLVSAHNDIVMIFAALLGLLYFLQGKYVGSILAVVASVLIKFATIFMIPALFLKKFSKISNEKFLHILLLSMVAGVLVATFRTNFQPWYILYALPFAALLQGKYYVSIPVLIISAAAILQYLPYLYLGTWDNPVPMILNYIMVGAVAISILLIGIKRFIKS